MSDKILEEHLFLNIEAYSVNKMYGKQLYTTAAYKNWIDRALSQLSKEANQISIFSLRESFKPEHHFFSIEYEFGTPNFWNSGGIISKKSMDCTNMEKSIQDILFDPKYNERGVCNLNADDRFVASIRSSKLPSSYYYIAIKVIILPKSLLTPNPSYIKQP